MTYFRNLVESILKAHLEEGDKKVFDKNSGYNSSYDQEFI